MNRLFQAWIGVLILALSAALCRESIAQVTIKETFDKVQKVELRTTDSALEKLLKERLNTAADEVHSVLSVYHAGRVGLETVGEATSRFAKAGLELAKTPEDRIKYLEITLDVAKTTEAKVKAKYDLGDEAPQALFRAKGLRLDAEIALLREREAAKSPKDGK